MGLIVSPGAGVFLEIGLSRKAQFLSILFIYFFSPLLFLLKIQDGGLFSFHFFFSLTSLCIYVICGPVGELIPDLALVCCWWSEHPTFWVPTQEEGHPPGPTPPHLQHLHLSKLRSLK